MLSEILDSYNTGVSIDVKTTHDPVVSDFYFNGSINIFDYDCLEINSIQIMQRESVCPSNVTQYEVKVSENTSFKARFMGLIASEENCISSGMSYVCGSSVHIPFNLDSVISNLSFKSTLQDSEAVKEILSYVFGGFEDSSSLPRAFDLAIKNYEKRDIRRSMTFYSRLKSKASDIRIDKIFNKTKDIEENINVSLANLERLYQDLDNCKQLLHTAEQSDVSKKSTISESFDELMLMKGKAFERISFRKDGFTFLTKEVFIYHSEDLYGFGSFKVNVSFRRRSGSIRVLGHRNNTEVSGFIHPHISSAGQPCWGNIAASASEALGSMNYIEIITLVNNLLSSYSADNPYITIGSYAPQEGPFSTAYDQCMSTAIAVHDCIYCDRNMCSQYSTRFDRCWQECVLNPASDDADLEDCINCGLCYYSNQAVINLEGQQAEVRA